MSPAAPAPAAAPPAPTTQPGGAVMLFGRRVSWDSLIVAGATLLGIIVLWQLNKSATSQLTLGAAPNAGDSSTAGVLPSTPPGTVLSAPGDTSSAVSFSPSAPPSSTTPNTTAPMVSNSTISGAAPGPPAPPATAAAPKPAGSVPRNIGPWTNAIAKIAAAAPVGGPNASTVPRNIGPWTGAAAPTTVTPNAPPSAPAWHTPARGPQ